MAYVCPVVVMDDEKEELIDVAYGLSTLGLPIVTHRVLEGDLERKPEQPYRGVRLLFTDLHILGANESKPEIYVGGLISLIKKLIHPSSKYMIVFWSKWTKEVDTAWQILQQRLEPQYLPINYATIEKELAKNAALTGDDEEKAEPFITELNQKIQEILDSVPQLTAFMDIEGYVSQSAAETTDKLLSVIAQDGVLTNSPEDISKILARMSQEAIGYSHAHQYPVKGLVNAFTPIIQDYMERNSNSGMERLKQFLNIENINKIALPDDNLKPRLNDFFIHSEGEECTHLDRGSVIRLSEEYLNGEFLTAIGLVGEGDDWREAICSEFHWEWGKVGTDAGIAAKAALRSQDIYAVELSALCDHAQNKPRSHRYLLAIFHKTQAASQFYRKNSKPQCANESIYCTPEITIGNEIGRLLVSCRVFATKPYQNAISGVCITRFRKDTVDELSHHYATHMRRPGKIAFN